MIKKILSFIGELAKIVLISLAIIIPIRYFLVQPFYVKGASMEPSFYDSEYLIVDEISYRLETPKRGDVIVFRYPRDPQQYFIKRVIGLPGEKIQFKNGDVYIYNNEFPNGFILKESYLPADLKTYSLDEEPITLKDKEYFVLGDNRYASKDSRSFGAVNQSFFIGKVLWRGWPVNRAKLFTGQINY